MANTINCDDLKFVCRCGHCNEKLWIACEYVPLCPHEFKRDEDIEFSIKANDALIDMINHRYSTKADAARAHGISRHSFYRYRKSCGYDV